MFILEYYKVCRFAPEPFNYSFHS